MAAAFRSASRLLPFLVIDLVVAAVLMSMGMMMVPPAVVALPFKLAFFVVADGWADLGGAGAKLLLTVAPACPMPACPMPAGPMPAGPARRRRARRPKRPQRQSEA